MPAALYPEAIWADNGQSGGSYTSGPPKLVIHTTETSGMPGYQGGGSAPHVTYDPRSRIFIQHEPFTNAARALRNESGGVQTNRDTALQLEIICYSAKNIADQQPYRDWVGDLPNIPGAVEDLNQFINWVCNEWNIPKVWPGKAATSYSVANAAGFRMTNAEWDGYNGVCGHQHVPENDHWDPGAFPWALFMEGEEMTNAELQAGLTEFFGGRSIGQDDQAGRIFIKGIIDSVWWAKAHGAFLLTHLVNGASLSGEADIDEDALASQIVQAMTPALRAAVKAELDNLTLRPV